MPKILLVGQDSRLLVTRAAVLAKTNAGIVYSDMVGGLKILERESFDLVVLCHSLTENQIAEISEVIHRRWPGTRILMVVSHISQSRRYKDLAFDATSLPDPARLIRRASELLEGLPHRIEESMRAERHQAAS